jgi:Tol biopolymer transport system component
VFRTTLALGAVLALGLIVACGGGGSPTSKPSGAPSAAPTTAAATATATATAAPTTATTPTATEVATPTATTAATATPTATPTALPPIAPGERIAFGVRSSSGSDIYSMSPDGTDLRQLTTDVGNHLCASYSGDASHIAYCGDGSGNFEIWTVKADGSEPTQVTHLEGRALFPDESHDGTKIAFGGVQGDDTHTQVYVVDASTGEGLVALTSCEGLAPGCSNDYPAWSPDDKQIVYIHSDDTVNEVGVNQQVWVMNSDGSAAHALTTGDDPKDQVPNWSPDGKSIVYSSGSLSNEGIWVMKSDGSGSTQLSGCTADEASPCAAGDDFGPVWSPDGTKIAFLRSFQDLGTEDRPIYVMNADGSDQQRVTADTILAAVPSWQ